MAHVQLNRNRRKSAFRVCFVWFTAAVALVPFANAARAFQTVSLAWDASPSLNVAGYLVYRGNQSGVYTNTYDTGTNLGLTFTDLIEGQTNYFRVVAYSPARALGVPSSELSFLAPGLVRLGAPARAGNPANISFPVAVGHTYQIQASTDLATWTTIYTSSSATSNIWINYSDPQTSEFSKRFYRLILN